VAGLIVGLVALALLGAMSPGIAESSEKLHKFCEFVKVLVSFATLITGIVLWIQTGNWLCFFLPVIPVGILIAFWDWGSKAASKGEAELRRSEAIKEAIDTLEPGASARHKAYLFFEYGEQYDKVQRYKETESKGQDIKDP
jgi:hypothetical protein